MTLHSLLDRDVYRGGAIVVGPVRRGRGRRVRVERRVIPVTPDEDRRREVFERELWRIAVEHLRLRRAGPVGRARRRACRARAAGAAPARCCTSTRQGELKRHFLLTAVERNKSSQLRLRALQEIAHGRDAEAMDQAVDVVGTWSRDERREGAKVLLQALAERRIGRRDQAGHWIWDLAEMTRDVHEEYAAQRWPETKRLLGLLVNSSGAAHARNARRLVNASRKHDRRLQAATLWPPRSCTRRRPWLSFAMRARASRASPARWRVSCCATSPSAVIATGVVAAAEARTVEAPPTTRPSSRVSRRSPRTGPSRSPTAAQTTQEKSAAKQHVEMLRAEKAAAKKAAAKKPAAAETSGEAQAQAKSEPTRSSSIRRG